jgi:hypothetical protein
MDGLSHLIQVIQEANIHDTRASCEALKELTQKYLKPEAFSGDFGCRVTMINFVEQALGPEFQISEEKIKDSFAA